MSFVVTSGSRSFSFGEWLLASLVYFSGCVLLSAEDYRTWTDEETGRTLEAVMIRKNSTSESAQVRTRADKTFWLKAAKLIEEDREYIKLWVKPEEHLTARIAKSGKKGRTIEVVAKAGSKPMEIKAYWRDEVNRQPIGYPRVYKLKKGENRTFTYNAGKRYLVRAFWDGKLVDEEAWNSKTGL